MDVQGELNEFIGKLEELARSNCPSWLQSNSYSVGVMPGHNLDLLQISFDFRIERAAILAMDCPEILKDPSNTVLTVIKRSITIQFYVCVGPRFQSLQGGMFAKNVEALLASAVVSVTSQKRCTLTNCSVLNADQRVR